MFVSFFTICIRKNCTAFNQSESRNFFMCIIRTERTFMYQKTIKVSGLFILVMGLGCAYNWGDL